MKKATRRKTCLLVQPFSFAVCVLTAIAILKGSTLNQIPKATQSTGKESLVASVELDRGNGKPRRNLIQLCMRAYVGMHAGCTLLQAHTEP